MFNNTIHVGLTHRGAANPSDSPVGNTGSLSSGADVFPVAILGNEVQSRALAGLLRRNLGTLQSTGIRLYTGSAFQCEPLFFDSSTLKESRSQVLAKMSPEPEEKQWLSLRNLEQVIDGARALIVACAHLDCAQFALEIAPHLFDGMSVVLVGAPILASLELSARLEAHRPGLNLNMLEIDSPFHSKSKLKRRVNIAGRTRNELRRSMTLASCLSHGLMPASSIVERGLLDLEALLAPVFLVSALLGGRVNNLRDLSGLLNRSNLTLVAEIEQEVSRLSQAYQGSAFDFVRTLREDVVLAPAKGSSLAQREGEFCYEASLAEALSEVGCDWFAPGFVEGEGLNWTYLHFQEELARRVINHLVPVIDLARLAGVKMPGLEGVTNLASAVLGVDLRAEGRELKRILCPGLSYENLTELVNI